MWDRYISLSISLSILVLIAGGIGQWLHISTGSLIDWVIGVASFWWLLIVVTIPWNIYFDAREAIAEATESSKKGLEVDRQQLNYVQKIARWSIIGAIALHLISAITLYLLAVTGISNVGYVSSALTLLLTILRPAIRGYQYLNARLSAIKQEIKYPRQDAIELRERVKSSETAIAKIEAQLDRENPDSWISQQQQQSQAIRERLARLQASLEEFQGKNALEHEQLSREAQNAIAQLNEDSQFLGHVREIIRFVKTA
ncbi:MAG: hypothetical protein Tsb0014_12880 [Pleurocapsa sp.]